MSENGKFPDSELAEIPGGRLAKEAAANWLALRREGGQKLGVWISPIGPRGSYRTYADQQMFWQLYQSGKGNLAARPGTSNHGLGHAVDLGAPGSMRKVVDTFGAAYGWRWGEAPSENWHVTYYGGGKAGADELGKLDHPTLKVGDSGADVKKVQTWLAKHGAGIKADGAFGPATLKAVKDMYRAYGHEPHERFGDVGWSIVEGKHPWCVLGDEERSKLAELFAERRTAKRNGGWDKVDKSHLENARALKAWLVARRKEIWRNGTAEGWKPHNRRRRYLVLKRATGDGKKK
jgi:hypothetical protein